VVYLIISYYNTIIINCFNKYLTKYNKTQIYIYIYNKKLFYKKIKNKLKIYLIFFLDNFEYSILTNKKLFRKRNILRLHRKTRTFTPFKSDLELYISNKKIKFKNYIISNIKLFATLNLNLIFFYKNNLFFYIINKYKNNTVIQIFNTVVIANYYKFINLSM
jgi:hypothetical protein